MSDSEPVQTPTEQADALDRLSVSEPIQWMPDWLVPLWEMLSGYPLLAAAVIILLGFFLARLVVFVFRRTTTHVTSRTSTDIDDKVIRHLSRPIFATVFGEQIIVESVLCPQSDVSDVQRFNETILRTHKYFPLSTISLDTLADGESYYHMFGSLSATSRMLNIMFEIEILARNVIQATEAYEEFLSATAEA